MGRECSRLDPSYQRHITFACTGCYQLYPHRRLAIITLDLSPVPIYRSWNLKWWIAWWAKADCTHITFCPGLLHNWIQRHRKEMNPGCWGPRPIQYQRINRAVRKDRQTHTETDKPITIGEILQTCLKTVAVSSHYYRENTQALHLGITKDDAWMHKSENY